MEYYSAMKTNTFASVLMKWMSLEPLIQSEVRKRQISCINTYIGNLKDDADDSTDDSTRKIVLAGQQRRHRRFGHNSRRAGWVCLRE